MFVGFVIVCVFWLFVCGYILDCSTLCLCLLYVDALRAASELLLVLLNLITLVCGSWLLRVCLLDSLRVFPHLGVACIAFGLIASFV